MSFDLKKIAKEKTEGCLLIANKTKVASKTLNGKQVTLNGVAVLVGKKGRYPVFTYAEDPNAFFCGGKILMDIVDSWLATTGGAIDTVSECLAAEPIAIRMTEKISKNGDAYTAVEIL